jgi:hypothetical protein
MPALMMCSLSVIEVGTSTPERAASPVPANPEFVARQNASP